jgi:putative tributyrin esterase
MALIECSCFSESLGMSIAFNAILPQPTSRQVGMSGAATNGEPPVLYLLHGMSDDHTIWCRRTSIERYVAPLGLAVVMPNVHRSSYTDMKHGHRYWTFVSEELPGLVHRFFRVSAAREDTFVAGLSMGGYGAFKLALRQPERFAAAASLSGGLFRDDFAKIEDPARREEVANTFGAYSEFQGSDNDLMHLVSRLAKSKGPRPKLFQCCGTEDFLYAGNVRFRDHARLLGLDLTYEEGPGTHEWGFWDRWIQRVLEWLPLRKTGG